MLSEVLFGAQTCSPDCVICGRLRAAAAPAVLLAGEESVSMSHLATAAGVPVSAASGHCPEGASSVVVDAYRRAADELFVEYAASFRLARSWPDKLRNGLERLLRRLAAEPAVAYLVFVAPMADEDLREIRESFRARHVELLAAEQDRHLDDEEELLPDLALEMMVGAVFRTIASLVAEGRAPELPALLEDVAFSAAVFEPRVALAA